MSQCVIVLIAMGVPVFNLPGHWNTSMVFSSLTYVVPHPVSAASSHAYQLMWELGCYAPLMMNLVASAPRARERLAEVEGRVQYSKEAGGQTAHLEFRVAPRFAEISRSDQVNVLNHELKHAEDFQHGRLQQALLGLPDPCRRAVLEVRAIRYAREQDSWRQASIQRQQAELRLEEESMRCLRKWIKGQAPLGNLTYRCVVKSMRDQDIAHPRRAARDWLRQRKQSLINDLLAISD